ncbi:MAG: hypothetical protein CSB16_01735 [Clostridiales bacterium]|nr:MAG: hypothetical protein CSB16_01735 [Clostridiales bacterium]
MDTRKRILFRRLRVNVYFYLVVVALLSIVLLVEEPFYGYISSVLFLLLLVYSLYKLFKANEEDNKRAKNLRMSLEEANKSSLFKMPLPVIITDPSGHVVWYNSKMKEVVKHTGEFMGKYVSSVFKGWKWENIDIKPEPFEYKLNDINYKVIKSKGEKGISVFYFYDETDFVKLGEKYIGEEPLLMYLKLDNFEEVIASTPEEQIPFLVSEVNAFIKTWVNENNAILLKLADDEFIVLLQKQYLDSIKSKKFEILDSLRNIKVGNKLEMTLSIGISTESNQFSEKEISSKKSLELALSRGGDQAVIKTGDTFEFFGGGRKNVERKSRVRSRTVATAISNLVTESDNIYIMGHRYPDMDCFASSIGMYRVVLNLNKQAFIVLDTVTETIASAYDLFKDNSIYKFVGTNDLKNSVTKKDLLIIVDTHRPSFTESPDIIDLFERKVVIDHHRRGAEVVTDTSILYQEPYASSASEMISEIIQYLPGQVKLEANEATVLLAGIVLDTKNYVFNTGFRTFEAASFLRKYGASPQLVQDLFKDNLDDSILKSRIISGATEIKEGIVISVCDIKSDVIKKIISQSADELINIKGIHTAFTLGINQSNEVFVSARSNGNINVQVILEKLGGGGHLETAGAQFNDKTLEEVQKLLLHAINDSLEV